MLPVAVLPPEEHARARNGARLPMSAALRVVVLTSCTLLWLSGVLWLVLHWGFAQRNEFGALPNPSEPAVMRVHGFSAVAGVFILGWIGAGHVVDRWSNSRNRPSGWVLASCAAVLVASGYALYYTTGDLHTGAALAHEWIGALSIVVALTHWLRIRAAS